MAVLGLNILQVIRKFIRNKDLITNIHTVHAFDLIIYGYLFIGFINFMLKGKNLLEYTNLCFSDNYEKNDKIILK